MVIDTSALVCIIKGEPEAPLFLKLIRADQRRLISVVSIVEAGIVLEKRFGATGSRELEHAIQRLKLSVQPVDQEQGRAALLAFWRFGRGLHPAALNFGDCFTYALARTTSEALLFKGEDFSQTDLRAVQVYN